MKANAVFFQLHRSDVTYEKQLFIFPSAPPSVWMLCVILAVILSLNSQHNASLTSTDLYPFFIIVVVTSN